MAFLARLAAPLVRTRLALLSTSAARRNATPDWEDLIGGRAGVERKRQLFEDKYRAALEAKAKKEGVTVEELKRRSAEAMKAKQAVEKAKGAESLGPVAAGSVETRKEGERSVEEEVVKPLPSASKQATPAKKGDSPVKVCCHTSLNQRPPDDAHAALLQPLHEIMDLSKVPDLTTSALSQLWTTYHQAKGFLSAAIPTETYLRMISSARKYPLFVLPLTRDVVGEAPDGSETDQAVEMHLLNWALLPQPPSVNEPVPPPSTVLFTPLAEYKARQEFAQPYLILTHYTDLSSSHGLVLMRGEISTHVALNDTDAQVLAVRMQLFYNDSGKGGEVEQQRRELLRAFHETPEEFDVQKLIKAGEISELQ
ncbi:SPOSA6832_05091, partial [Sporobolomyces salmonicolor]